MARVFDIGKLSFKVPMMKPASIKKEWEEVDVAIFAEGTYPFVKGGVSSVIHQIIESHPNITFGIIHVAWDKTAKQVNLFPKLPHVKWVHTIFLAENIPGPRSLKKMLPLSTSTKHGIAKEIIEMVKELNKGEPQKFYDLYNNLINPLTREIDIRRVMSDPEFLKVLMTEFSDSSIPLNDLYWVQKEFSGLALNLLDHIYPPAKVYHSHSSGYAGFAAAIASTQHDKKFVLTEHSLYIRDVFTSLNEMYEKEFSKNKKDLRQFNRLKIKKGLWDTWFSAIGKITYAKVNTTTYLYNEIANDAIQFGSDRGRAQIIPNGINYNRFSEVRLKQTERHQARFKDDFQWRIGFVGRIVPVKGILDLIAGVHQFKTQFKGKFHFDLIGPFEEDLKYYEECVALVKELKLDKEITFHGPQDVLKVLEKVDLMLLTSHSEALPMAVLEAMASGIPITSTAVGSVKQIMVDDLHNSDGNVEAKSAGLIVPTRRPELMAGIINQILSDKDLYESCRQEGPKRILHSFKLDSVMEKYCRLYTP